MSPPPSPLGGLCVLGTDTGVGKTIVSSGLLRSAVRRRLTLIPFKPAETGCEGGIAADATRLREAARADALPLDLVCPFRFAPPVAPAGLPTT